MAARCDGPEFESVGRPPHAEFRWTIDVVDSVIEFAVRVSGLALEKRCFIEN